MNIPIGPDGYTITSYQQEARVDARNVPEYRYEHIIRIRWVDQAGWAKDVFTGYGPTPAAAAQEAEAEMVRWEARMAEINRQFQPRMEAVS